MKVVTAEEMVRLENLAYKAGYSEQAFMEAAGSQIAAKVLTMQKENHLKPPVAFLAGPGNNGGDCFAAACALAKDGFATTIFALAPLEKLSPLAKLQAERFLTYGKIAWVTESSQLDFSPFDLLVDGIFGTGFHGEIQGLFREAIVKANQSGKIILSVDVPSGIHGTRGRGSVAIQAFETLALGMGKLGCFLPQAWSCTGKITAVNFGLPSFCYEQAQSDFFLLEEKYVASLLPPILRERHKYSAGYVAGFGGSQGMAGAPTLASYGALRAGAGIVRLFHPQEMGEEFSAAPYEIIRASGSDWPAVEKALAKASSFFIGPGMGIESALLRKILPLIKKPCVIDADALTLLAEEQVTFPRGTILTPHHGEMQRLLHQREIGDFPSFLRQCKAYAEERGVTLVLKGAPTFIFHPLAKSAICGRGDPGMATAGSGDVLTGIIAAFLAQGKAPQEAAYLGVFLHGVAGERAAEKLTSYSMVASDIIAHLPQTFKYLLNTTRQRGECPPATSL